MAVVYLLRHGRTQGNVQHRYVGRTDEPLCPAGAAEICQQRSRLEQELSTAGVRQMIKCVYVSPMERCRQTARLLFPHMEQRVSDGLREMDFGEFEYCNYAELAGDARYQAFIDSGGKTDFPQAESQALFRERCADAFLQCVQAADNQQVLVFVVHGGTIMSILNRYSAPHRDYFDWQCAAGGGYRCELEQSADAAGICLRNITPIAVKP